MATTPSNNVTSAYTRTLTVKQREKLLEYALRCATYNTELGMWRQMLLYRDRAYQSQLNMTAKHLEAIRRNMNGDARKIADLTVPIVMPQVESAVAYQAGVYCSSWPIFPVVAPPDKQSEAIQFQTIMNNHAIQYGWTREMIKWFRDGEKYNWGALFCQWQTQAIQKVTTSTDIASAGQAKLETQRIGGNKLTRIDPYNCFMNMSVDPAKYHTEGDFFGWNVLMNRLQFRRFVESLDKTRTSQLHEAIESSYMGAGVNGDSQSPTDIYIPPVNQLLGVNQYAYQGRDWLQWAGIAGEGRQGNQPNYKGQYLVTPFLCRAMPDDFGAVGRAPTIYFCYIVNWKYIVYVEEIVSPQDFLPIFIIQPNEDGLGFQTKSLLDNALPFQDMSSSLWNIGLESQRRKVFDRLIYNERFIDKKDIDPASSVARIPLRNASAFKGDDIGKAIYQIPYREDNLQATLQMSDMVSQMGDQATGQNKVVRGQFQKGNKSVSEFETTMDGSNARQQLKSMSIEHQAITPLKETLKTNVLQFQDPTTLFSRDQKDLVNIDPVALRDSIMEFKLTDGLLPVDKLMNPELLTVFLQTAQAMPMVTTEYDVLGMFLYWIKLKGGYWVDDFKRNPEQQQQALQMMQQTAAAQEPPQPTPPTTPPGQ